MKKSHDRQERDAMDEAMQEALESVERIERSGEAETSAAAEVVERPSRETELQNQLIRLAADFENFRKRSRKDQEDTQRYGIERLLIDLLPIIDNFDRAVEHAEGSIDPVIEGVRMVGKQFRDTLSSHGVTSFTSVGESFDPEKHEAVSREMTNAVPPAAVLREIQRGYLLHGRLLRPARVVVAVAPPRDSE